MSFKFVFCLIFILLAFTSFEQGVNPVGARSLSLGNASVALIDVWSFHHNPGAVGAMTKKAYGVSYENRYLLKELQSQGLALVQPTKLGVLSLGAQLYGFSLYRSNRFGLGYGLKLSEKLFAGVQLNYHSLRIHNYGSKGMITGEMGLLAKLTDNFTLGAAVFNLNRAKLAAFQDDRLATYLRIGASYKFSSKLLTLFELEKEVTAKLRYKGGLEYLANEKFYFRLGTASNPLEFSFGSGFIFSKKIKIDFGSAWNQLLGWSPHAGLTVELDKK